MTATLHFAIQNSITGYANNTMYNIYVYITV